MTEPRTLLHAFAIVGVAEERVGNPKEWITVKKVVYTKDAADATVERLNGKADGRTYFWQSTSLEPLG